MSVVVKVVYVLCLMMCGCVMSVRAYQHTWMMASRNTRIDAELDALRKSQRWQRLRNLVVRSCPICSRCDRSISEIVDHIVPARVAISQTRLSGMSLDRNAGYFMRSNLTGLCRPCHYLKTMEDKTHTGPWPDVVEKERLAPKKVYSF